MSHQQYLFRELPIGSQFRYETPEREDIHIKSGETEAYTLGEPTSFKQVSPNILVFPVHPFSLVSDRPTEPWQVAFADEIREWIGGEAENGDYVEEELG